MLRCATLLALVLVTSQHPQSDVDLTPSNVSAGIGCVTKDNENGFCVLYYQCKNNTVVNVDGEGLIDLRVGNDCPSSVHKCCRLLDVESKPTAPPVPPPQKKGCGWRNPNGLSIHVPKVDNTAGYAEFPWMVAILKTEPKETYIGGGSLIHPRAVLTAAHVASGQKGLKIRAGEWDTQTDKEIYPHQERDVETVHVHKDFIRQTLYYNVALLILKQAVDLAPNVGVVCLPPQNSLPDPGTRCLATGWGKTKFAEEGAFSVTLKKVEVPLVKHGKCLDKLRTTRLGSVFELHTSFMCAGGEKDVDTCRGDGGSPLVCPIEYEENRYYQSGIVAWGVGCGTDGVPGVYVNVAKLRDWIDDRMKTRDFDLDIYNHNALIVN